MPTNIQNIESFLWLYLIILIVFIIISAFIIYFMLMKRKFCKPGRDLKTQIQDFNEILDPYGFAYSYNKDIFYSRLDAWQKKFGYCHLYDVAAPSYNMIFDSEPVHFEYKGEKWMIEFWKGQYGVTTGCEVGVYKAKNDYIGEDLIYYGVDKEDFPNISLTLFKDGTELFKRMGASWWMTGFVLGKYSQPSDLTMHIQMTFNDQELCNAFYQALLKVGYGKRNLAIRGSSIWVIFKTPCSKQPYTRYTIFAKFRQWMNKTNCKFYNRLTKKYENSKSLEKLQYLFCKHPLFSNGLLRFAGSKKRFIKK